ncbi:MAG: DUF6783 domain-containing protein [Lachnospiraceae bacterium]
MRAERPSIRFAVARYAALILDKSSHKLGLAAHSLFQTRSEVLTKRRNS